MQDPRIAAFKTQVQGVLQHLQNEFAKLQTGRANAALVEHIEVDAYGQRQELRAVAGVSVSDARTIVIQPWDRSIMQNIEKALQQGNLGTSPVNDGTVIRVNLQPMTEERRKELVKIVQRLAEDARISIRKHRQDTHDGIKEINEEDVKRTLTDALQKEVDDANLQVADIAKKKEEEVMKV